MLNFVLVVYVASSAASFQTMGSFKTKADCESMKAQLSQNFPTDIQSACLSMTIPAPVVIAADPVAPTTPKPVKASTVVAVPKPKPFVPCHCKEYK